jgi:hypothetical protein
MIRVMCSWFVAGVSLVVLYQIRLIPSPLNCSKPHLLRIAL